MNFVTIADLNNDILNGIHKIPKDFDLIIGVPRSGMLVASIIALYMNKPLADIDGFTRKSIFSSGSTKNLSENVSDFSDIRKVLVVEDSSYHGNSIREAKAKLRTVAEFLMTLCLLNLFIKYRPFSHINGFGYQGLDKMAISLCTVILFYYLPLKKNHAELCAENNRVCLKAYYGDLFSTYICG